MGTREVTTTTKRSMEEEKEYHRRYFRAVNHPIRKRILTILKSESLTLPMLALRLGLDARRLTWHLQVLEYGHCVTREQQEEGVVYAVTREGLVVDYLD